MNESLYGYEKFTTIDYRGTVYIFGGKIGSEGKAQKWVYKLYNEDMYFKWDKQEDKLMAPRADHVTISDSKWGLFYHLQFLDEKYIIHIGGRNNGEHHMHYEVWERTNNEWSVRETEQQLTNWSQRSAAFFVGPLEFTN